MYVLIRIYEPQVWSDRSWINVLLSQAETRAEFAERSVAKLEKTIDDLEGKMILFFLSILVYIF